MKVKLSHYRQEHGVFLEAAFAVPVIISIFLFSIYVGLILIIKGVANDAAVQGLTLATSHPDLILLPDDYTSADYCDTVDPGDKFCDAVKEVEARATATSSVGLIGSQGSGKLASYAGPPRLLLPNRSQYSSAEEALTNEPLRLSMDIVVTAPVFGDYSFTFTSEAFGYYEVNFTPNVPAEVDCNGFPFTHSDYMKRPCDCSSHGPNFVYDPITHQCVDCGEFHFADRNDPNANANQRLPNGCYCPSTSYCQSFSNDDDNNLAVAAARDPQGGGVYGECGCECRWSAQDNGQYNIEDCACGLEPEINIRPHDSNNQDVSWQSLGYGGDYEGNDWFFMGDGSDHRVMDDSGTKCNCQPALDAGACEALFSNTPDGTLMTSQGLEFRLVPNTDGCYCLCGSVCPDGATWVRPNSAIMFTRSQEPCLCACENEKMEIDLSAGDSGRGACVCKQDYGEERCLNASPNFAWIADSCDCVCSDAQKQACQASGGSPPEFDNYCHCGGCPNVGPDQDGLFRCDDPGNDGGGGG